MAGVSCRSTASLECPSSWHGSMEKVPTPGERTEGLGCWEALLADWEGTQRAGRQDERISMKETTIWEKNEAVIINCYPWVSELTHHLNKYCSSLIEFLPSPLQTHKKHCNFYLQLTLRGSSSPWLPSSQFCWVLLRKERVNNGVSK